MITDNKCVLFMKGTPDRPQCGFSATVVRILDIEGVDRDDFLGVNILEDDALRQGIKDFTYEFFLSLFRTFPF
jgi:monothiol glutaredoxin